MDILIELNIEFIVAPYEADAQMAYMVKEGIADFAISEDSDLIAYGCPKVLLKLNPFGTGQMFDFAAFYKKEFPENEKAVKQLQGLAPEEFTYVMIMAGCEYLDNIERLGLKSALKIYDQHKTFAKVVESLRANKTYKERIPADYETKAAKVAQLFNY
jgi:exonuclease 1